MKIVRVLLILIAVAAIGVALSYPIRYRLAQEKNDSELDQLAQMRNKARQELIEASGEDAVKMGLIAPQSAAGRKTASDAANAPGQNPDGGGTEANGNAAASSEKPSPDAPVADDTEAPAAAVPEKTAEAADDGDVKIPENPTEAVWDDEVKIPENPTEAVWDEEVKIPENPTEAVWDDEVKTPENPTEDESAGITANATGVNGGDAAEEGSAEPTPEPTVKVTSEPTPTPEPTSGLTPEPTVKVTSKPASEPTSGPTPEAMVELMPTPEATPTPEPTSGPTPEAMVEPMPTSEVTPEATSEPTPELTVEPTPTSEPTSESTVEPTPTSGPTPEPTLEPNYWDLGAYYAAQFASSLTPDYGEAAEARPAGPTPAPTPDRSIRKGPLPYALKDKVVLDKAAILPELRDIYDLNNDLMGWITIPDTVIDYPVVQSEDPEFYLDHDFYGEENINGQIILDMLCDPYTPSYNLVVSGHHMKNGSMFGGLPQYRNRSYWEKHKFLEMDTLMERKHYILFACFYSADYDEDETGFRYNAIIDYKMDADRWLEEIVENQLYDTGIERAFGDEFITLTTCDRSRHRNGRFVVVGRRIREGETFE